MLSELKNAVKSFAKISDCSEQYNSIYKRLNSLVIELEDIAREIDNSNNTFEFNAENLTYLNERLGRIFSIEQKHNLSSTAQLLELLEKLKIQLADSASFEDRIEEQKKLVKQQEEELTQLASGISERRKKSFKALTKNITSNLMQLGMKDASFDITHQNLPVLSSNGIDKIEFLFSSNKGVESKLLNKVASGGELSRLMLTIKSILANNKNLSTIIFDEIDSGVSGDIADKMAVIMQTVSRNIQVIAITHLPQVAAKGEFHIKIYKENINGKTTTRLNQLSKKERVEEIAKMLSGEKMSDAAKENAMVLLGNQ